MPDYMGLVFGTLQDVFSLAFVSHSFVLMFLFSIVLRFTGGVK